MKILYVRHGKSVGNAQNFVGKPDTPLAEEGLGQARTTGQDLRNHNVTTIVCSPYIRAEQTAEIIAGELGIPIQNLIVIDELRERHVGTLEGEPRTHARAYFYENDTNDGFESQQALIERSKVALDKIRKIAQKSDGTVVVVGHAVSGFYLLQVAKGRNSYQEFDPFNQLENAEFTEITAS